MHATEHDYAVALERIEQLEDALVHLKLEDALVHLTEFIPICQECRRIRQVVEAIQASASYQRRLIEKQRVET